jgi:2'-5' RNA ligase
MNIFAVQTNIEFQNKPEWLDTFKQQHNSIQYDYHVTLKQPCKVTEEEIEDIKNKLSIFVKDHKNKISPLIFSKLIVDDSDIEKGEGCIMFADQSSQEILEFQKEILALLNNYDDYYQPETEEYEKNFRPHITIATNLNKEQLASAVADLPENQVFQGTATQLILVTVRNTDPENNISGFREEIAFDL